jgi:hypothetical protein
MPHLQEGEEEMKWYVRPASGGCSCDFTGRWKMEMFVSIGEDLVYVAAARDSLHGRASQ